MDTVGRKRLANRRLHELIDFDHGQFRCTAGIGRFPDGSIAEVFLNVAKDGTALDTTARDAAILASFALQHGASADELRRALTRDGSGRPSGPLGTLLDMLSTDCCSEGSATTLQQSPSVDAQQS